MNSKQQLLELLKIHYGFKAFRPGQERVIDNILAGLDTVVIMPTGGGKSLCYQLPALILDGVTLVISPLIALMKDQVDALQKIGIPATFINSSLSLAETAQRLEAVKQGHYKLLYVAPERFYSQEFLLALREVKVGLFAVDEAHCISQWGHDFRPSYLKLKNAIELLGRPVVAAFTATATPEVREDIIKQLGLGEIKDSNNPPRTPLNKGGNTDLVITGFVRPNLQFGVINTTDSRKPQFVLDVISSMPEASGIIYVGTRARVDELLQFLLGNNIEAVGYHAGMEAADRKWVQENFMSGRAKVIVATNAFGLGIDKRDIRFVVHYDMPGTIEAYYQEAGRAGRDDQPSFCLLLYSSRDRHLQEFFIQGDNPSPETIMEIYELLQNYETDTVLITYAELAEMLSDDLPEMAVGTSLKILERLGLVARSHERVGQAYIKITQNSKLKTQNLDSIKRSRHKEIVEKLLSKYEHELVNGWYVNLEEVAEVLQVKKESLVRLIKKLADQGWLEYVPPFRGTELKILQRLDKSQVKLDFAALRAKLKRAYKKLDLMENYAYHPACRQKYILDYFGEAEAPICAKCDNCLTKNMGQAERAQIEDRYKRRTSVLPTKLTQLETWELWKRGMSMEKIAEARGLTVSTIIGHLCFLIEKGLGVDIDKLVSPARQKKILAGAEKVGAERLSPIRQALGEDYSWEEIKLTLAKMRCKK
jgi:ATP-dependent DNA helicase RecQ